MIYDAGPLLHFREINSKVKQKSWNGTHVNSCHEILAQPFVAAATPSDSIRRCNEPFSGSWLRSRDLLTQLDCNFLVKTVEIFLFGKKSNGQGNKVGDRWEETGLGDTHCTHTTLQRGGKSAIYLKWLDRGEVHSSLSRCRRRRLKQRR